MNDTRTIDIHAHMLPEEAIRRLGKESPRVAPKLIEQPDGTTIMEIAGKVVQRPTPREIFDLEACRDELPWLHIDRSMTG